MMQIWSQHKFFRVRIGRPATRKRSGNGLIIYIGQTNAQTKRYQTNIVQLFSFAQNKDLHDL